MYINALLEKVICNNMYAEAEYNMKLKKGIEEDL